MTPADALDVARDAIWVLLKIGSPIMLIALIVGLMISLFQALTQIQEMTLAFVPKILAIFLSTILFIPFMLTVLTTFTERMMDRAAEALGLDRAEIRRRNYVRPEQMPYSVGLLFRDGRPIVYDSGDYPAVHDLSLIHI